MNKNYESPKAEIRNFISEDVVTTSGTGGTGSLTVITATKTFANRDANVKWAITHESN